MSTTDERLRRVRYLIEIIDNTRTALEQSNAVLLWYVLHYGNAGGAEYRIAENKAVLAKLEEGA